ncbi:hypothetical protein BH24ACT9_BH24ACT9_14260 [soil metagenome]
MSYRAWPAALVAAAAMTAAGVVVGEHAVDTSDGCLDSAGWFTATPVAVPIDRLIADIDAKTVPYKLGMNDSATIDPVGRTGPEPATGDAQISGCLDVDRIEIPVPAPAPDGRA